MDAFPSTSVRIRGIGTALSLILLHLGWTGDARANTAITVTGPFSYQISGSNITATVQLIDNATNGTTGTLRLELWAFPTAYNGSAENGYTLGTYVLGTLPPQTEFTPPVTETMPYTAPPNGTWVVTLFVTEYIGSGGDNGYSPDNYVNFSTPLQVGAPPPPPPPPATSRLVNLSVRSNAGSGSQTLIAGFVIGGSGSKAVLVRGDGPSLTQFGVSGALPDPVLGLYNSASAKIGSNSKWGGSSLLSGVFSQVGAFALPANSLDAALYQTLSVGAYTAQISSTNGDTGVALVEVYDADQGTPASRFVNLSARSQVGTGAQALIAGFVIAGAARETLLVRGDGPALSQFGVGGVLANPQLTLFDSTGKAIATDTGWGSAPVIGSSTVQATVTEATAATFTQVGAFALPANSPDCAFVATLPPGAYTANVSGVNNTTGVALVEVYEVPSGPVFTTQPSSQTINSGGSYTLTVAVSVSATFQWYLNGVAIPGATGSSYLATQAGTYTVVATDANGSTTSSAAVITIGGGGGGGGGSVTGTWVGTWEEDLAGGNFCAFQKWSITFVMTQSGSSVNGQFNMTVLSTSADSGGGDICPNSDGQVDPNNLNPGQPGDLVQGTLTGSSFTIFTDSGIQFSGTVSGDTITGTGDASMGAGFSVGPFTLTKQ